MIFLNQVQVLTPNMVSGGFMGRAMPQGGGIYTFRGTILGNPNVQIELIPADVANSNFILNFLATNDAIRINYDVASGSFCL